MDRQPFPKGFPRAAFTMKAFKINGKFKMGRAWTPFSTEVAAADEAGARDRILSTIGSRHRVNRRQIELGGIAEIKGEAITDPGVQKAVRGA